MNKKTPTTKVCCFSIGLQVNVWFSQIWKKKDAIH